LVDRTRELVVQADRGAYPRCHETRSRAHDGCGLAPRHKQVCYAAQVCYGLPPSHVLLCWLGLLLIRIAENQTGDTWRNLRDELQRLHLGTFTGPGRHQPTAHRADPRQREILNALEIPKPPRFLELNAANRSAQTG
jgi:hypothetical protein